MARNLLKVCSMVRTPMTQVLWFCLGLSACNGQIEDRSLSPMEERQVQDHHPVAPQAGMRMLSPTEYRRTVGDLFGDVRLPEGLELGSTGEEGESPFTSVRAAKVTAGAIEVEQWQRAAADLSAQVFAPERAREFVGCDAEAEAGCVSRFLETFGRRAFRRPLTSSELTRYEALIDSGRADLGVWESMSFAVEAMLQSPMFLYRSELGHDGPDGEGRALDDWELASRLSYLIIGSTPDEALLDAAAAGELATAEGIAHHAMRLFDEQRAQATLLRFFEDLFSLDALPELEKDAGTYPDFSPQLAQSMHAEIQQLLKQLVFVEKGSVVDLFRTRSSYIDDTLAAHYGYAPVGSSAPVPVMLPEEGPRQGILTTAGMMALLSRRSVTSPTLRGLFIRERLLCGEIPLPPPDVSTELPPPPPGVHQTQRERFGRHRSDAICAGCHQHFDPLGLAFEHFDGDGSFRPDDRGLALDVAGEIDGLSFDGARELTDAVASHEQLVPCLTRRLIEHATGSKEHLNGASIEPIAEQFEASDYRFRELLLALVTSPVFRTVKAPHGEPDSDEEPQP